MTGLAKADWLLRCLDYTVAMETGVKMLWISSYTDILHIMFCTDDRLFYMLTNTTTSILLIYTRLSGKSLHDELGELSWGFTVSVHTQLNMCICRSSTCNYNLTKALRCRCLQWNYNEFSHIRSIYFFFSFIYQQKPSLCSCSYRELTQLWRPAVISLVSHEAVGKNPQTLDGWREIQQN